MNNSFTSTPLQKFTFDYFSERLNANNYKDICRRRDEKELQREETIMILPIFEYEYLRMRHAEENSECLRSHGETLARQARLKTMKNGHQFMMIESRVGTKSIYTMDMWFD